MTTNINTLSKAAEKGDISARYLLAMSLWEEGWHPVVVQRQLKLAAYGGHVAAQRYLGIFGLCGILLKENSTFDNVELYTDACYGIEWIHQASLQKDVVSIIIYGKCLEKGIGVEKNEKAGNDILESVFSNPAMISELTESQALLTTLIFHYIPPTMIPIENQMVALSREEDIRYLIKLAS